MSESKKSGNFFWKRPHINKVDALQCWMTETMTTDLTLLALAVVLGLIHIVLASHAASWQRGYRWAASARNVELPPLTGVAGRFARALGNFGETFPLFAAALLVAHISGKTGVLTLWGAGPLPRSSGGLPATLCCWHLSDPLTRLDCVSSRYLLGPLGPVVVTNGKT